MQGRNISNFEPLIHKGRIIECAAESNHKVYVRDAVIQLLDTVQFRGWECTVFSLTYYMHPYYYIELLLRRDIEIIS